MNDGVAMNDQLNVIEDLMKVHQGVMAKGDVFEMNKAKFAEHFAQNEQFEQQKQQIAITIQ